MDELGFIITPNGQEFKFGEYKPYNLRDKDNPHDYHNTSFQTEVLESDEWKSLNLPVDNNIELTPNIITLASIGIIVGLNKTEGAFFSSIMQILFVVPDTLTDEQIKVLNSKKDELLKSEEGLSYIRVIDKNKNTIERVALMSDYYKKYVDPFILDETKKRS